MKAVRIHKYGSPEVLSYENIPVPEPKLGGARAKIDATALNFIDNPQRTASKAIASQLLINFKSGSE